MEQSEQPPQQQQESSLGLLNKIEELIDLERSLTDALEKSEPLLNKASSSKSNNPSREVVRPIPANIQEAEQVLAFARALSGRTSAPAGWNPNLPVVGFATPNPLPHQLRGGALGTLQLERAKQQQAQQQTSKKRQREEEQEKQKEQVQEKQKTKLKGEEEPQSIDPKRRDLVHHKHELDRTNSDVARNRPSLSRKAPLQPVLTTTMNLSDSSSDEDDSD